jgi:hypothetical protein
MVAGHESCGRLDALDAEHASQRHEVLKIVHD